MVALLAVLSVLVAVCALQGCGGQVGHSSTTTTTTTKPGNLGPGGIPKVNVTVYAQSGQPLSQYFMLNVLNTTVRAANMSEIMHFDMWQFGNAYYITDEAICGGNASKESYLQNSNWYWPANWPGYSSERGECFLDKCGWCSGFTIDKQCKDSANCYKDGPYCQHGKWECVVSTLQACAKKTALDHSHSTYMDYVPFVICLQAQFDEIASSPVQDANQTIARSVRQCADSGLATKVLRCYGTDMAALQQIHMAQHTYYSKALGLDQSFPILEIASEMKWDGYFLSTYDLLPYDFLLSKVCDAWESNGGSRSVVHECEVYTLAQKDTITV